MNKTIHKYPLEIKDTQIINMPFGAIIRHVAFQDNALCLWAEVYPNNPPEPVTIVVIGTGHLIPRGAYIGTVHDPRGFVWHVIEQN